MSAIQSVSWKQGFPSRGVDAKVAHDALERIRKARGGKLDPTTVVAETKKKKRSVLRKFFEWDDTVAGQEYRLVQARHLLRSVQIVYEAAPRIQTRAYEVTTEPRKGHQSKPVKVYRTAEDVMADPDTRAELLKRALGELTSFQRRFRGLQELAVVFRAVDELLTTLEA